MKASEIIDQLTEIIKTDGDLEVTVAIDAFVPIDDIDTDYMTDEISEIRVESIESIKGLNKSIKWIEIG